MNGTSEEAWKDAIWQLEQGMKSRGCILSSASSIAPATPARNLDVLSEVVEKYGYYWRPESSPTGISEAQEHSFCPFRSMGQPDRSSLISR